MTRNILWIDDSTSEREAAARMLAGINGLQLWTAASSTEAHRFLDNEKIDCVVTDILRRGPTGNVIEDDGYAFVTDAIRPKLPELPVIFHTKNLPTSFTTDRHSQYLSKWDSEDKKAIELEVRISDAVNLYEAFAELSVWNRIMPRLETVRAGLLEALGDPADIMKMDPNKFEELVAELLQRIGFKVLWIPGGNDQGIDIVAASDKEDFLIDVKRYALSQPVGVELVRAVYGVADHAGPYREGRVTRGGIITSSHFTRGAKDHRASARVRPLLKDGVWLSEQLRKYAPRLAAKL